MDPETYVNPKEYDPSRWDVCIVIENFVLLLTV